MSAENDARRQVIRYVMRLIDYGKGHPVRSFEGLSLADIADQIIACVTQEHDALAAAVDRVRRRHPRGDEEGGPLAPGLWCPTCGHERADGGYGGCPDRNALSIPPTEPAS